MNISLHWGIILLQQYLNDDFEHLCFNFEPTNPEEVTRLVLTMKEASPGWDGVPMKVCIKK